MGMTIERSFDPDLSPPLSEGFDSGHAIATVQAHTRLAIA
jgi:hypothetical protein